MGTATRSVVVTGASSGIGHATAQYLARRGYVVYAGVRKQSDADRLAKESDGRIHGLLFDVADGPSILEAVKTLERQLGDDGLYGLVNNAGIGPAAPLEFQSEAEYRKVFEVNVFGLIAVTQAMLALIRRARGRIVNIGSVGDRFTVPFGGALCSSKSAVRSITEALRMELHPAGIHVCLIRPTSVSTPAVSKVLDHDPLDDLPTPARDIYGDMMKSFNRRVKESEASGSPPEVVAMAVWRALSDRRPHTVYTAGVNRTLMSLLPAVLPDRALDAMRLLLFGLPLAFGAHALRKAVRKNDRSPVEAPR